MSRLLLVLRPEPGASATVARAEAAGFSAIAAPLFEVHPTAWEPVSEVDAVLFTSGHAARMAGPALAALTHLPAYAVGEATAAAVRAAGFADVTAGDSDAESLLATVPPGRILHLAGRDYRPVERPGLVRRVVYGAAVVDRLPDAAHSALEQKAVALLHSPRAAREFRRLLGDPEGVAIGTFSPAVAEAAGAGWRAVAVAERPTDAALLAATAGLCDQTTAAG